jgi:aryl-alcohol dehydrogenase-like predicted oxidoreductase
MLQMSDVERFDLAPGYSIARIINGCWQLTPDHGGGPGSTKETQRIFAELVDCGFTTFDGADIYLGVEKTLGDFRRSLSDPDSIQIHTKYAANRDTLHELTAKDVDAAVDRSLRRLGVERLDLLQYHWWNYEVPGLETTTERLVRAQEAGKIRCLGVTNFDTAHVREIVAGGANIVSMQAQYSLIDRRPTKHFSSLAETEGIVMLPYGSLAGGFFTEKYLGLAPPSDMNRSLQKYRLIIDEFGGWDAFQRLLKLLSKIAGKHGTKIGAIATRWVLDQDCVGAVILGTGSKSRAKENLGLSKLSLDEEDHHALADLIQSQPIATGDMYDLERDMEGPHSSIIKMNLHDTDEKR